MRCQPVKVMGGVKVWHSRFITSLAPSAQTACCDRPRASACLCLCLCVCVCECSGSSTCSSSGWWWWWWLDRVTGVRHNDFFTQIVRTPHTHTTTFMLQDTALTLFAALSMLPTPARASDYCSSFQCWQCWHSLVLSTISLLCGMTIQTITTPQPNHANPHLHLPFLPSTAMHGKSSSLVLALEAIVLLQACSSSSSTRL